jgi:hypothetical protein
MPLTSTTVYGIIGTERKRETGKMKKQTKTQTKPVDYTPLITRNEKGTVLSIPTSAISGWISIFPTIKPVGKKGN